MMEPSTLKQSPTLLGYIAKVIVPASLALLVAIWLIDNHMTKETVKRGLVAQVNEHVTVDADVLEARLQSIKSFAETLADNDLIINGLIDMEGWSSYLPTFIRSLKLPLSEHGIVTLVDYKGRPIYSTEDVSLVSPLSPSRLGFMDVTMDLENLQVVAPIMRSGQAEGAIVLSYPAASYPVLFGIPNLAEDMIVYTATGKVAFSTNSIFGSFGDHEMALNKESWVYSEQRLDFAQLKIVCLTSINDVYDFLIEIRWIQAVGLVSVLLLMASLFATLIVLIVRQLKNFTDQVSVVEDISGLEKRMDTTGPREFAYFARAFNSMAEKLERASKRERKMLQDLREAQKLEAVGQLAGGIAHEINTPSQYIGDNLQFLEGAHDDLFSLLENYYALGTRAEGDPKYSEVLAAVSTCREDIDIEFLSKEIPAAITQSQYGVQQISRIVLAMKEFSHPGAKEKSLTDINRVLENTLMISRNEWKHIAEIETSFADNLPNVMCLHGEINQVFLNIIVNAAHAIAAKKSTSGLGKISLSTDVRNGHVFVEIKDTGTGIPEAIRDQVFNPFFTTKALGKGTGQGLAIAYDIVVKKHAGLLSFESVEGEGTTFIIKLPLDSPQTDSEAA